MNNKRRMLIVFTGASFLGGCGFRLRGAPEFAFSSIVLKVPDHSPVGVELRRQLEGSGKLKVLSPALPAASNGAPTAVPHPPSDQHVVFELLQEVREKSVVGMNATGQVREFQLRSRARFRLRDSAGRDLIPETELEQHRDVSFNEGAVLGKEAEESLLYRDMQTELVRQLMRRLGAIRAI